MQKHHLHNSLIKKIIGVMLSVFLVTSISAYANTNKIVVTTKTADGKYSNTKDKIFITVYGTLNDTKEKQLKTGGGADFTKGLKSEFQLFINSDLGDIIGVKVRLDGTDGWQFDYIKVKKGDDATSEITFWKNEDMWVDDDAKIGGRINVIKHTVDFDIHKIWNECNPNGHWNGTKSYSSDDIGRQEVGQYATTKTESTTSIVTLGGKDSTSKATESSKSVKSDATAKISASWGPAEGESSISVSKKTFNKVLASAQSSSSFSRTEARESSSKIHLEVTKADDYVLLSQSKFRSGVLKIGEKDARYAKFNEVGGIELSLMTKSNFKEWEKNKCHINN